MPKTGAERLDTIYAPSWYFGVLFAERRTAEYFGQIARAVRDSTTWGQFRNALPPEARDELDNSHGEDAPPDDAPFPGDGFAYGDDGCYIGGWPAEEALEWFPEDLIEKYGGYSSTPATMKTSSCRARSPTISPRHYAPVATGCKSHSRVILRSGWPASSGRTYPAGRYTHLNGLSS